jgi:hypothetical protein
MRLARFRGLVRRYVEEGILCTVAGLRIALCAFPMTSVATRVHITYVEYVAGEARSPFKRQHGARC